MSEDWQVEIESRLAHQEHTMDQLSDTVARQHMELEELRRTCQLLFKKLKEIEALRQEDGENKEEKPPHY